MFKCIANKEGGKMVPLTEEEISNRKLEEAAAAERKDKTGYIRERGDAYAPVHEQLEMIYYDKVNGTNTFVDHIDAVKKEHPKPE